MCPALSAIFNWLRTNQQSLAIWLEGLALVAIFGLELKEYKRQGRERKEQREESAAQIKIAQDSADAAKASADALINIERAWIEVYLSLGPEPSIIENTRAVDPVHTTVSLEFVCTNYGKTPAWINTKQIGMMILREHIAVPNIRPTETSFPLIGPELVAAGADLSHEGHVECEGRITKGHPALVYGEVSYRDIFHKHRTTTFGYWITEDKKVERLPFLYPAYNEHT